MIGKNFTFDGETIPYTTDEARAAGWIGDVDWNKPATRNSVQDRQDWHGTITSRTLAAGRLITISGEFFDVDKADRGTIRKEIQDMFALPSFPTAENEIKVLAFTDDDDTDWFMNAKVYELPEFDHDRGEPLGTFSIRLYAEDPIIYSDTLVSGSGDYGLYGGTVLPTTLPTTLDGCIGSFSTTNNGNVAAPTLITITGEIENPKIWNLTTGRFFKLDLTMVPGDELVIDCTTRIPTVKLNGGSISEYRMDGSNWLFADPGANSFLLTGDDFDYDDQTKASITVEHYHTRL